jgi:hypothetical protein
MGLLASTTVIPLLAFMAIAACTATTADDSDDTSWLTDDGSTDSAGSTTIEKGEVHFGTVSEPAVYKDAIGVKEKHPYRFGRSADTAAASDAGAVASGGTLGILELPQCRFTVHTVADGSVVKIPRRFLRFCL